MWVAALIVVVVTQLAWSECALYDERANDFVLEGNYRWIPFLQKKEKEEKKKNLIKVRKRIMKKRRGVLTTGRDHDGYIFVPRGTTRKKTKV